MLCRFYSFWAWGSKCVFKRFRVSGLEAGGGEGKVSVFQRKTFVGIITFGKNGSSRLEKKVLTRQPSSWSGGGV